MKHFLFVYHRRKAALIEPMRVFERNEDARAELLERELAHRTNKDVEVVVISGASEELVRMTHSRYFKTLPELLDQLEAALISAIK